MKLVLYRERQMVKYSVMAAFAFKQADHTTRLFYVSWGPEWSIKNSRNVPDFVSK
jgi:hypothetical protein